MDMELHNKLYAKAFKDVYTPEECQALILQSERHGYIPAVINTGPGSKGIMDKSHRDSDRTLIDDSAFAADLLERVRPWLPAQFKGHTLAAVNERLRFLRYGIGQQFRPHYDGSFKRPDGSQATFLTIQVYLNGGSGDPLRGGETIFFNSMGEHQCSIQPCTGHVVIFDHDHLHGSSPVLSGTKYVIRTDVLYDLVHADQTIDGP